jgi:hypothetical protein
MRYSTHRESLGYIDWAARLSGHMTACRLIPPRLTFNRDGFRSTTRELCEMPFREAAFFPANKTGYPCDMIKLLQKALEAVRRLPPDSQDAIARVILSLTGDQERIRGDPSGAPT